MDDQKVRAIFEKHFKDWFAAKGVEAVTIVEALPIQKGVQLEKQDIVVVIEAYENVSVLITHLFGFSEKRSFQPRRT